MDSNEAYYILSFGYKGCEYTPDRTRRYSAFEVKADDGVFAGKTEFETTSEPIQHFAQELDEFYKSFSNNPVFVAGTGDDVLFRLVISKHDWRGNVAVECEIKRGSLGNSFDSVHTYNVVELTKVDELARFFHRVLISEDPETFQF